jgi:hypothetical protein
MAGSATLAVSTLDKRQCEENLKSLPSVARLPFSLVVARASGTSYDGCTVFARVTRALWPDAADHDLRFIDSPLGYSLHTSKSAPACCGGRVSFD